MFTIISIKVHNVKCSRAISNVHLLIAIVTGMLPFICSFMEHLPTQGHIPCVLGFLIPMINKIDLVSAYTEVIVMPRFHDLQGPPGS